MVREAPLEEATAAASGWCAAGRISHMIFVKIVIISPTLCTSLEDGNEAVGIDSTTVWCPWWRGVGWHAGTVADYGFPFSVIIEKNVVVIINIRKIVPGFGIVFVVID